MNLTAGAALSCWLLFGSQIATDEQVVFYPTYGHLDADGDLWTLNVRGVVFEPEDDSIRRGVLVSSVRRSLPFRAGGLCWWVTRARTTRKSTPGWRASTPSRSWP